MKLETKDPLEISFWPRAMYSRVTPAFVRRLLPMLLLLALPAALPAQFNYITVDDTITITGYTGPGGAVGIPATVNGLPVTRIAEQAFFGKSGMTSVTIPKSVGSIGERAFYGCTGLTGITVDPLNPSFVGLEGVLFDKSLTLLRQYPEGKAGSYRIPHGVTTIGADAFADCTGLTSVTLPDTVISFQSYAFSGCTSLTGITIPKNVSHIGWFAFSGCTALTSVTIPSSVTTIGIKAFSGCTSLTSIAVDPLNSEYAGLEGVLFNKHLTFLLQYPEGKAGSYLIPDSVSSIGSHAFFGCTGLTSVTIPDRVTSFQSSAFHGCTGLTSLEIPNSVTTIEARAFEACTGLTTVTIGNSVSWIRNQAFSGCTSLASITIPNSVSTIETAAFHGCTGLTSVIIPGSVSGIGENAFSGCTGLTGLYFRGQPPALGVGSNLFLGSERVTVYYLPGATHWGPAFGRRPTALWLPRVRTEDARFGVRNNQFEFDVSWAAGQSVVVEMATGLANPVWSPLQTLTLTGDSIRFTDPDWMLQPTRFYRLRTP